MKGDRFVELRGGQGVEIRASRLPVLLLLTLAVGMLLVSLFAFLSNDKTAAMTFLYGAIASMVIAAVAEVVLRKRFGDVARRGLVLLLATYLFVPAIASIPLIGLRSVGDFSAAYFEMASALTTTGATIFHNLEIVPDAVILWRSMLAGFGGLLSLVAALAILAPLSIGGFEVDHMIDRRAQTMTYAFLCASEGARSQGVESRIRWALRLLLLPYMVLMVACTFALAASGVPVFEAVCLALGSVSTTGFVPVAGGVAVYNSLVVELILILTIVPAAIGVSTHAAGLRHGTGYYIRDPELRYMAILVFAIVALLFLRHWIGAIETRSTDEIEGALTALWGTFFMALSFVTTTGFESASWEGATEWSGLKTPGVALMGLAIIGGGAASTAGGIKLVRAAVLAKHSMGELRRLARPSSVQPIFSGRRAVTFDALLIVWVFVMLYAITVAICSLALTATGMKFVEGLAGSIAAISNTGPLLPLISGGEGGYAAYSPLARYILCLAMVVGRMETLAVVALFSFSAWRR
jgi:trk system potassium uptake protein TrkH